MGVLTGRFVRSDITSITVSGVNITTLVTDCSLEVTVDEIDVNALKDLWMQREYGRGDWTFSVTKLATAGLMFPAMALTRALVGVTVIISGGIGFYGSALAKGGRTNMGDTITEECTFVSGGGSPTINAATT